MNFGEAIQAMQDGHCVARSGWNGKGMFVYKTVGNTVSKDFIPKFASLPDSVKRKLLEMDIDVVFNPSITMFTAAKEMQPGWLASQADILANDWEIV
jgi:hypothetical protein